MVEGLEAISRVFPVPIRGIDSDNDSAFINETLVRYCADMGIEFTRSRAYRKNDQAWIEQKNGSVIRRFVGHERHSGAVAGQVLAHLYGAMRLYVNYFQPSFQLLAKSRNGSSVTKRYSKPATPCERLLERDDVSEETKRMLRKSRLELDPVSLLHSIRESQSALAAVGSPKPGSKPDAESLDSFLKAHAPPRLGRSSPSLRRIEELETCMRPPVRPRGEFVNVGLTASSEDGTVPTRREIHVLGNDRLGRLRAGSQTLGKGALPLYTPRISAAC